MQDCAMRVLQLVAADRWTGAAATALQVAEALRGAGVDCVFGYRPGRNLEERLRGVEWCHPALPKEKTIGDLRAAVARIRTLAARFDLVHVHLPHDHVLTRVAVRRSGPPIVRGIHNLDHLRADPYQRWLLRETSGIALANSAMEGRIERIPALRGVPARLLPVALEPRFLAGGNRRVGRQSLALSPDALVVGTIGKLVRSRGHDTFVRALAAAPGVHGVIIGKGSFQPSLRALARGIGVDGRLTFAGYVEEGLENLFAAMDIFVFPAAGSDHAHRAIAEVSACGVPTIAADLPGVRDLVEPGITGDLYPGSDAAALAAALTDWAVHPERRHAAGRAAGARARTLWTPERLAVATLDLYAAAGSRHSAGFSTGDPAPHR
jgi:glycosyltransferase involved in cell wall biosynthesis